MPEAFVLSPKEMTKEFDPSGEVEWKRLQRHFEEEEGFWVGFLFSASPHSAGLLKSRLEAYLEANQRSLHVLDTDDPAELSRLDSRLPSRWKQRSCGGVWIEAVYRDLFHREGPWVRSWTDLLRKISAKRAKMHGTLDGGLIVVASPQMKRYFAEVVPDLWEARRLEIDLIPAWVQPSVDSEIGARSNGVPSATGAASNGSAPPLEAEAGLPAPSESPSLPPEPPVEEGTAAEEKTADKPAQEAEPVRSLTRTLTIVQPLAAASQTSGPPRFSLDSVRPRPALLKKPTPPAPAGPSEAPTQAKQQIPPPTSEPEAAATKPPPAVSASHPQEQGSIEDQSAHREIGRLLKRSRRHLSGKQPEEASRCAREALKRYQQCSRRDPRLVARTLHMLARSEKAAGRQASALRIIASALGQKPAIPDSEMLRFLDLAAQMALEQNNLERAMRLYRRALRAARRRNRLSPQDAGIKRDLSLVLNRLALASQRKGRSGRALVCYVRSLAIRRELLVRKRTPQTLRDVSYSCYVLAKLRAADGHYEEALPLIEESCVIDLQLAQESGFVPAALRDVAASMSFKSHLLESLGQLIDAQRVSQSLEELRLRHAPRNSEQNPE